MFVCSCRCQDPPPLPLTWENRSIWYQSALPDLLCDLLREMVHRIRYGTWNSSTRACHGASGSHPNTHICFLSPTPTHTWTAVSVQQEGTKATDAPLTPTSSQKGHFSSSDLHLCWTSTKTPCASSSMVAAYIPLWTFHSSPLGMSTAGITPLPSFSRWTLHTCKKFPHFQTNRRSSL